MSELAAPERTDVYSCPACGGQVDPGAPGFIGRCPSCGADLQLINSSVSSQFQAQSEELNRSAWLWYQRALDAGRVAAAASVTVPVGASGAVGAAPPVAGAAETELPGPPAREPELGAPAETPPPADVLPAVDVQTPARAPGHRVAPAVLLQGLGALLLLAALTVVTTVTWSFLPPMGQAALLAVPLITMGAATVWFRDRLPTTSTVLAVLTVGAGLVEVVALPGLLPDLAVDWYPPVVAAVGAIGFGAAGHLGRIVFWRVFAVATVPMVPVLAAPTMLLEPGSTPWDAAAALAVITAPFLAALLAVIPRLRESDEPAARAAWWTSAVSTLSLLVGLLAGLVARLDESVGAGPGSGGGELTWALAMLVVAALAAGVGYRSTTSRQAWYSLAAAAGSLPVTALVGWWAGAESLRVLIPLLVLAGSLLVVVLVPDWGSGFGTRASEGAVRPALPAWAGAGAGLLTGQLAAIASVLVGPQLQFEWVLLSGTALVAGGAMLLLGVRLRSAAAVVLGLFVMLGTWVLLWETEHLGTLPETAIWPSAALLAATGFGCRGRFPGFPDWWPAPGFPILVVMAGTPGLIASWIEHQSTGGVAISTGLGVGLMILLVLVSAVVGWLPKPRTSSAALLNVALMPHVWISLVSATDIEPVLLTSVLVAAAIGIVGWFAVLDQVVGRRTVFLAVVAALFLPTTVVTVAFPTQVWVESPWQFWFVGIGVGVSAMAAWRPWPAVARVLVAMLLLIGLWWYLTVSYWIWGGLSAGTPLEVWSVPTLLVLLAVTWLWPVGGWRVEIATALALVTLGASTVLAWQSMADAAAPWAVAGAVERLRVFLVPLLWVGSATAGWHWRWWAWRSMVALAGSVIWSYAMLLGWQWDRSRATTGLAPLPIEYYTIWTAGLVAAGMAAIRWPVTSGGWWREILQWPTIVVLTVSTLFDLVPASLTELTGAGPDLWRSVIVLAGWTSLAVSAWLTGRPVPAAGYGSVAIVVLFVEVQQTWTTGVLEAVTYPLAAAVAAVTWLWVLALDRRMSSWITLAPAVALVLIPSSAVMWTGEPLAWRLWLTIVLAVAGLGLGLRLRLAGMVWPAAAALLVLAVPVVIRWAQEVPTWVPLAIGGTILLVTGARFEATRRAGRRAGEWASTLH